MRQSVRLVLTAAMVLAAAAQSQAAEAYRTSFRGAGLNVGRGGCGCETRGCDARPSCGCATAPSCGCEVACDSGCGTCKPCCPRILPAIVNGIDCVLTNLLGNPCNVPCPRPTCGRATCCSDAWSGYSGGCGCGGGGSLAPMPMPSTDHWTPAPRQKVAPTPPAEGDPFKDDELNMPPTPPKETRAPRAPGRHSGLSTHRYSPAPQPLARPITSLSQGRPTPAVRVTEVSPQPKVARVSRAVKPIAHEEDAARDVPRNPLRD